MTMSSIVTLVQWFKPNDLHVDRCFKPTSVIKLWLHIYKSKYIKFVIFISKMWLSVILGTLTHNFVTFKLFVR